MTSIIIENITSITELSLFSEAYNKEALNVNISKLSRELKKDRKTVKKYLEGNIPSNKRKRSKYLDQYREIIVKVLSDKYQSFDYIDHLYRYLKREVNIKCSRATFNRYIRKDKELDELFKRKAENSFTERFETPPGQQAQFDLKEKMNLVTTQGEVITVNIPTLTLGWSRFNCRQLITITKVEYLLAFLAMCFEYIGGVPRELVIDNLKQFVEKARFRNNPAILNAKFEEFCKDYGIIVKPCVARRPQTKGKTETQNKTVDQLKNYNGKYEGIEHMCEVLDQINKEDNESISQATKLPRTFLLSKEKGELLPLPSIEIRKKYHLTLNEVTVSNESLISYKSNKYSVDKAYIGMKVGLTVTRDELHIYYNNKIIAVHPITNHLLNIKEEHKLKYSVKPNENNITERLLIEMENLNYD